MSSAPAMSPPPVSDSLAARLNMIEGQLRPNGIRDERILGAMETLSRAAFAPPSLAGICYIDEELSVLPGLKLSRPLVTARLIQYAEINQNDVVLDVASASGYTAAILSGMAKKVYALESDTANTDGKRDTLKEVGITNIECITGKLRDGWAVAAPYNAIIINGGIEEIPAILFDQLAEGGRLTAVVRKQNAAAHFGEIRVYQKLHGTISSRSIIDATASLLPEFAQPKTFSFV